MMPDYYSVSNRLCQIFFCNFNVFAQKISQFFRYIIHYYSNEAKNQQEIAPSSNKFFTAAEKAL